MPSGGESSLVLVVDDEPIIADTLVMVLNQHGFDARAVYDGETACVLARTLKPDVLISDVIMKRMSGIELAILVCQELPNCKVLLISGQAETIDLLRESKADGHHFEILQKPFRAEELLNYLKH